MFKRMRELVAVGVGLLMAGPAVAQTNHVAWSYVDSGSWNYHAIYSVGSGGAVSVTSVLAIIQPSAVVADNLVAVWYERDGSGSWHASSWNTTDPWQAIEWVKAAKSIDDSEDERWQLGGSGMPVTLLAPEPFQHGVLASDPMADDIASDPDPDTLVAFLSSSGYPAADLTVRHLDGNKLNDKLNGVAAALHETLVGDPSTAPARSMAAWVGSGTIGSDLASSGVEVVGHAPVVTSISVPDYECDQEPELEDWPEEGPVTYYSRTCLRWRVTTTVTQSRVQVYFDINTEQTIECPQTRIGTKTTHYACCAFGDYLKPPPCPTKPNPELGEGCGTGGFGQLTVNFTTYLWGAWQPPCQF